MSNPQLVHRANQNSSLYNTIKARNSKQNVYDYATGGESNICPVARSKIIVNPTTSMNADGNQTIKFQLPNFGLLEDLYLQTKFNQGDTNADTGAKDCFLVDMAGAFAFTRVRITYQGNTLWECTPEWVVASQYTRANKEKSILLDKMLGSSVPGTSNDTAGSLEGRKAMASIFGGQTLSCPLKAWFCESLGRAWDLYSLSSHAFVEVDYRSVLDTHGKAETVADRITFNDANLVCYVAELDSAELAGYQARNYAPGSVSSQLGFSTTLFSESIASGNLVQTTDSSTLGNKIKIQSISGLVRRLYVFATDDTDRASSTAKAYMKTIDLALVRLSANNQTIYEIEDCGCGIDNVSNSLTAGNGYKTDYAVECFRNNLPFSCSPVPHGTDTFKLYDPAVDGTYGATSGNEFNPSHVKVINFAYNPDDYSSADGSLSFSQLGNPEIEVKFSAGANGSNDHTVHVVAEVLTINTYNTSASGQINFKMITE